MNRQYMGQLVFNHPDKRTELNEIVHPIVHQLMDKENHTTLIKVIMW